MLVYCPQSGKGLAFQENGLAADRPIFNVFTIPEVVTLVLRPTRLLFGTAVVEALRSFPQFEDVAGLHTAARLAFKIEDTIDPFGRLSGAEQLRLKHVTVYSWWCPSVNSFKFQPCDHTPPRTQRLLISRQVPSKPIQMKRSPDP